MRAANEQLRQQLQHQAERTAQHSTRGSALRHELEAATAQLRKEAELRSQLEAKLQAAQVTTAPSTALQARRPISKPAPSPPQLHVDNPFRTTIYHCSILYLALLTTLARPRSSACMCGSQLCILR